ncbi:MAG: hypothetical protein ACPGSB_02050 [Opitutales bacterium]
MDRKEDDRTEADPTDQIERDNTVKGSRASHDPEECEKKCY